jgi:hypothetical protein
MTSTSWTIEMVNSFHFLRYMIIVHMAHSSSSTKLGTTSERAEFKSRIIFPLGISQLLLQHST